MNVIVQKFGGTSVASEQRRNMVIEKVIKAKNNGFSPVVVVSAMGRKGDPYATDTLLNLVKPISKDIEKRELDVLMACGEIISCAVLCATFKSKGYDCTVLTGGQAGIITDDNYGGASILRVGTDNLFSILERGIIPIVAGFQGITENGDITTLGRGGSDTTAAVLGEALKASEIQIYTDVDGIMTADPRIVPDAKIIDNIGYNEVFQFAEEGAKVIHPRAVGYAMRGNVPLVIKNTMSDAPGTLINNYYGDGVKKRLITGIAHMQNRTQVYIEDSDSRYADDEKVFSVLADNKISIDLINIFPQYKVFTIDDECTEKARDLLQNMKIKFSLVKHCSKISVIGEGIRGVPGVMARIIKSLSRSGIEILQTSDSHTTIWCLVKSEDTAKAMIALHNEFNLSE